MKYNSDNHVKINCRDYFALFLFVLKIMLMITCSGLPNKTRVILIKHPRLNYPKTKSIYQVVFKSWLHIYIRKIQLVKTLAFPVGNRLNFI